MGLRLHILLLWLLVLLMGGCGGDAATAPQAASGSTVPRGDQPVVSAHRGGAAYAPENTMLAMDNAIRLGVDQLETDTQLSADGILVLIHDDTLDRTTDCSGPVNAKTLAELQDCDAAYWFSPGQAVTSPNADREHPLRGQGIRIPTAEALIAQLAAMGDQAPELSIEIKDIPGESNFDPVGVQVAEKLVPLIQKYGLQDKIIVQSFWPTALDAVKRMDPSIRTQFLTTSDIGIVATLNLLYSTAGRHDILAPDYGSPDFNAEYVQLAHEAGKQVIPYTPDSRAELETVSTLGVDGLITNFPACLLGIQGRRGPGPATAAGVTPVADCPNEVITQPAADFQRPDPATCETLRPDRWLPAAGHAEDGADLRVVGLQYKQEVRHVESYETFRTKMRCLMEEHVVPVMQPGLPTLVVFNEDIGLMTLAIGSRGQTVRQQAQTPLAAPAGDQAPAGIATALGQLNITYGLQAAAYQAMFGPIDPRKQLFVAATDTLARAYSQTFSDIARDYGVYVVASNIQPQYRASNDPADIALFGDPDLENLEEVYIATSATVTNQTHLWGPQDIHPDAPAGEKNLIFRNHKVPVTPIEKDLIAVDEGPATGPEGIANAYGAIVEGFHLGFATSLPAFTWGYDFGQRPADLKPCADTSVSYMPCMDSLGVDVVIQAEANPGRWATYNPGGWQPLEWMESTWRTVSDPSVGFRYNITPHLVGNLLDLVFDGQSAITKRGANAPPRHYVGNTEFDETQDLEEFRVHLGDKVEFLVLAPWVTDDAPREELITTGNKLAPGSGDALENDYLETAVWADLTH